MADFQVDTSPVTEMQSELRKAKATSERSSFEISTQELDWMMEAATGLSRIQRIMGDEVFIQPRWKEAKFHTTMP